ncbi:hypothetical protein [Longispora fulva]|uniref:Uncharacterized protein n=1 Tax=Longispora fulva TaxID=619741 RepID=A0A8J7GT14_9ACTN|nr:hypothetical protein [Longispora fulva]MBG6136591.1 hypothetical protein [Longispora fulva]
MVVFGGDQPLSWLSAAEAKLFWQTIKRHFEVPGEHAATPDSKGLSYAGVLWRCDDRLLLGIQVFC